ncbi:MAG: hypothetical protein ACTHPD_09275, partial [Rhizomicrobium sp.]
GAVQPITATAIYFIKLGTGGEWEKECLDNGTIKFGYKETPHELAAAGDWESVWKVWNEIRGDAGAATRDVNQIQTFYEASDKTIFITFVGGFLYWCRPADGVEILSDGRHLRKTVDGWHHASRSGISLSTDKLSGNLLKVQMFRGTICQVKAADYLLRKLNDALSPEIAAAEAAERDLVRALEGLLRLLTWQDFELLVDLVFASSGWRRINVVGRMQKTVDLELVLPTTGERAFVQIKSQANAAGLSDYTKKFDDSAAYDRMFFVWHTGTIKGDKAGDEVTLIGPARLSKMVLDAGLSSWLKDKVS